MPTQPPFEPNLREIALADLFQLDHNDVIAGSFDIGPEDGRGQRRVVWKHADGRVGSTSMAAEDFAAMLAEERKRKTVSDMHQCRYLRRNGERCTAEVADPEESILLCTKHLAAAWTLVEDRKAEL